MPNIDEASLEEIMRSPVEDTRIPQPFTRNVSLRSSKRTKRTNANKEVTDTPKENLIVDEQQAMKPPEIPILKAKDLDENNTKISINNFSVSNGTMSSTLKRKRKVLLNPQNNHARTPHRAGVPLVSFYILFFLLFCQIYKEMDLISYSG